MKLFLLLALLAGLGQAAAATPESPPRQLKSNRGSGELSRVEISIEAGGDLKTDHGQKVNRIKMSVVGKLAYEERVLIYSASEQGAWRSVRKYDEAAATLKIGTGGVKPVLGDDRRLICVQVRGMKTDLYCPANPLSREELDLLNIAGNGVANSLVVDRLLPDKKVAVGDSWNHSKEIIGALVGLDAVSLADVQSVFVAEVDGLARLQMGGRVEGSSDGAKVEMELKAKYQVDLKTQRVNWLGLLLRENREVGEVVPGTEVVLRLEMKISPLKKSEALADAVAMNLPPEPTPAMLLLEHKSADGNWVLGYDRNWFITVDERDLTVLKLMEQGQRLAQCNISSVPKVDPAKLPTLAEFQDEVRRALDKSFGEFVEASESTAVTGYRVHRVVVRGTVNELPIEWHYYLVANAQGQQAAYAFTIDAGLVQRVGSADKRLVEQIRFTDPKIAAKPTPAK